MDKKVKFIWISDIHFKDSYKTESNFDTFQNIFYTTINDLLKQDYDLYYFLISGDIAFEGNNDQYREFKIFIENSISPNSEYNKKIRLLFCPGNHDISHDSLISLYQEILLLNPSKLSDFFKNKEIDISHKSKFEKLFSNYSDKLSYDNCEGSMKKYLLSNSQEDQSIKISNGYQKNALEGYAIDYENKIIIIILNTAWFSFGSSVEKFLKELYTNEANKTESILKPEWLINLMNYSQEAGRLITRINEDDPTFPYKELDGIMSNSNYKDYSIITMMHHPPEFLDWEEINSYEYENTNLYNLLKKSHILLTGHVHPPRNIRYESIFEDVLHLRSPLFLAHDDRTKNSLFPQNGFVDFDIENGLNKEVNLTYHNINWVSETNKSIGLKIETENIKIRLPTKIITNSEDIKETNPHKINTGEIKISKPNFD